MTDIALDPVTHDLPAGQGFSLVSGADGVRQALAIRLKFFRGEWFLDEDAGVPYYQQVFQKQRLGAAGVDAVLKDAILGTPGVRGLKAFKGTLGSDRKYVAAFTVDTLYGDVSMTWPV